jgi:hypothetical protein
MKSLIVSKVTAIWLVLVVLTGVTWQLADQYATEDHLVYRYITISLFVLAFFKVRLVIMYFMEIATAPLALRVLFETWVVAVCSVVITLYLT